MLSMPSFDFHLPPCMEGFLIHLSPLWQLPLWQLPLFPSVAQFPCVMLGLFFSSILFLSVSMENTFIMFLLKEPHVFPKLMVLEVLPVPANEAGI